MDITKISKDERSQIACQVQMCHKYQELMLRGDYYRILSWSDKKPYDCWMVVAKDGSEALVTYVQVLGSAIEHSRNIRLKGLNLGASYRLEGTEERYYGEELENCGFLVRDVWGDFQSRLYHFVQE